MRLLGLDWGEVRIGVSVSDPLGISSLPLPFLANNAELMAKLKELVIKYGISEIIVGSPRNMDGSYGIQAEKAKIFKELIAVNIPVRTTLWDERLTSKMAERSLIEEGMKRTKRKQNIDSAAACLMLQGFMDRKKHEKNSRTDNG